MGRVVVVLEHPSHWDALLPVLPWMREAGVEVAAHRPGPFTGPRQLRDLARALGHPPPAVHWLRRLPSGEEVLLVGTTDDLPRLRNRAGSRPLIALPRSPVPAAVVSTPGAGLREWAEKSRSTPAGALLSPGHEASVPGLAKRTEGLPFVMTGLPELDERDDGGPADGFVIIHPGDLQIERSKSQVAAGVHRMVLSRVLLPLTRAGAAIEVWTALHPGPRQDASAVIPIVRDLAGRRRLPAEQIRVRSRPAWGRLREARAVLVLRPDDVLRAVAAGAERVWWLPFAQAIPEEESRSRSSLSGCGIFENEEYVDWIAAKGWEHASSETTRVAQLLGPLSDGHASARVAQVVLAAAAEAATTD